MRDTLSSFLFACPAHHTQHIAHTLFVSHEVVTGKLFISGGKGIIGYRVALRLLNAGSPSVRVGLRHPEDECAKELSEKGAEIAEFEWSDEATYAPALEGVKIVFCVTPVHRKLGREISCIPCCMRTGRSEVFREGDVDKLCCFCFVNPDISDANICSCSPPNRSRSTMRGSRQSHSRKFIWSSSTPNVTSSLLIRPSPTQSFRHHISCPIRW